MIPGFEHQFIQTSQARISVHTAGSGAPLLLLHGYPQNHHTWVKVAPAFAKKYFCVVPDLRGYGDSQVIDPAEVDGVEPDHQHYVYSKRAMAEDMLEVMRALGHATFGVLGHDRGARVAYRLALDSNSVSKLGVIDVLPTGEMWNAFGAQMALNAYHWPFLAQPHPLPETLINSNPVYYLEHTLKSWTENGELDCFDREAIESYRVQMKKPARVHAMCEDYRAGASIDWQLDDKDRKSGRTINCPLHFLWSKDGFPNETDNPLAVWNSWAKVVSGNEIKSGHFAQEENPAAVIESFIDFFG